MYHPQSHDTERYVAYYTAQAGGDLSGFTGLSTQYGHGLGGIFRGLFRTIFPLMKKGLAIAAPHLKTAGKGIISDVISRTVNTQRQEGSGMIAQARRGVKRPPGGNHRRSTASSKKRRKSVVPLKKRRSVPRGRRTTKTRSRKHQRRSKADIF